MKLSLDPQLFKLFPRIRIGVVHGVLKPIQPADASGPPQITPDLDKLEELRASSLAKLQSSFSDVKSIEDDVRIKSWMDVYKKMGVNPRKSKPTHWALASRLVKDGKWTRPIGPIIDVYLVNQINTLLPHGGYDLTTLSGDLRLSLSPGGESFQPLGSADPAAEKTKEGEVVYRDDVRVLTRAWNHRDCEPTKIADSSTEFAIFIEETRADDESGAQLAAAVESLKELYETVYGKLGEDRGCFLGHAVVWSFSEEQTEAESTW